MEILDIKKRLSILQVLSHYNLQPDKNKRICCPFHNDKTPSMQVYPETNTVSCFSTNCRLNGKAIDQVDFIMHKEGITKHEALKKATLMAGTEIIETADKKHETNVNYAEIFLKLQQALSRSKKATQYLQSRNINNIKLEIGFNNSTGTHYKNLKIALPTASYRHPFAAGGHGAGTDTAVFRSPQPGSYTTICKDIRR